MQSIIDLLSEELQAPRQYIENVINLLDEGNTIPFIARYRKELHGAMDDEKLRTLETRLGYLRSLNERRDTILSAIEGQGKLSDALRKAIENAKTLAELEDLYRPYKQKRRTRATMAKEKGLEPLAQTLFAQKRDCPDPATEATKYLDPEKGVNTPEDALLGASDIIAEQLSDDAALRKTLREQLNRLGVMRVTAASEEDSVYSTYYDFTRELRRLQGHQILAINRGEKEKKLKVEIVPDNDKALQTIRKSAVVPGSRSMEFIKGACEDAWIRLISPSLAREARSSLTDTACEGAIRQFAANLRPLLMQSPVKGHVTMALDPGYQHGCKVAVVDPTGKVLDTAVIYPTFGEKSVRKQFPSSPGSFRSTASPGLRSATAPPDGRRSR